MVEPGGLSPGISPQPEASGEKKRPVTHHGSGTRFSGAPLWRFSLRRDEQRRLQEQENQRQGVPDGFIRHSDGLFYSPKERVFWKSSNQKYYLYNESNQAYTEIRNGAGLEGELRMMADASSIHRHEGLREDRHVIVKDLVKAAQALRMPIDHLARPVALFALYDGHKPSPGVAAAGATKDAPSTADSVEEQPMACAEFCARTMHKKLLARLADFKGDWGDEEVASALRGSCDDVDGEFLSKGPGNRLDGCSAVIALLTGEKVFIAGVGEAVGFIMEENEAKGSHQVLKQTTTHIPTLAAEVSRIRMAGGEVITTGLSEVRLRKKGETEMLHVSRAFGNRAFKATSVGGLNASGPLLVVAPDVRCLQLQPGHRCLLLACGEITAVLSEEEIADILHKRAARPRMACSALLQEAQRRGASGSLTALCVCLDWSSRSETEESAAKRAKVGDAPPSQVRCRQILVRHKQSKEPVDRVRGNKPVTRSLAEAEKILFEAIVAIESSPGRSVFTQKCKAVSECKSCLKGGELAGDLGWMSKGQSHPAVEAAAFSLPIGHVSDIVESDEGLHLLWRIA